MQLIIIAAVSENNAIGKNGEIPWDIPGDMKRLSTLTTGLPIIMGRKTHESIGRPLPGRKNIVLTRNQNYSSDGATIVHSKEDALTACGDAEKAFVFGGDPIYRLFMDEADCMEITHVHQHIEDADAFFPQIGNEDWEEVQRESHEGYAYVTYKRKNPAGV